MDWGQGILAPALFILIINTVLVLSGMVILWVVNVLIKNMGVVDLGWSFWLFITALTPFLFGSGLPERKLMLLFVVGLWSFRLTSHLFVRFIQKKTEDSRYAAMRQKGFSEMKILGMFLFQGLLILILSLPFLSIAFNQEPLSLLDFAGFVVALLAIMGETVADWELVQFNSDLKNKGKLCRIGLWNRSRHPNYFFEWLFWIGIALLSLQAPFGVTGIIACGLMLCIFFFFSIPATEKSLLSSKHEAYLQYQKEVPGFFPCLRS